MIIEEMLIHSPKYAMFAQGLESVATATPGPSLVRAVMTSFVADEEVGQDAANVSLETLSVDHAEALRYSETHVQSFSTSGPRVARADPVAFPCMHGTHTGLQLIMPGNVLSQTSWELPMPHVLYASQHNPGAVAIAEALTNSPLLVGARTNGTEGLTFSEVPPGILLRAVAAKQSQNQPEDQASRSGSCLTGSAATRRSPVGSEASTKKSRANDHRALVKQHSVRRPNQRWVSLDANLGTTRNQQKLRDSVRSRSPQKGGTARKEPLKVRHCEVAHSSCADAPPTQPEFAPTPPSDDSPTQIQSARVDSESPIRTAPSLWLEARAAMRLGALADVSAQHRQPTCMLLVLNKSVFVGPAGDILALEVAAALEAGFPILAIHVADLPGQTDGSRFERFFSVTPPELVRAGLYKPLAVPWYADEPHVNVSHALALKALDAKAATQKTNGMRRAKAMSALRRSSGRRPSAASGPGPGPTSQPDTSGDDADASLAI